MPHANVDTRVALITGAGSGIGLACALALDAAGVNVMLQGIDRLQLEKASSLLSRQPGVSVGDIAEPDSSRRALVETLERFGRLDILIANAGLYLGTDGWDVPLERVDSVVRVNVLGVMHAVHAVIPHMLADQGGDIVVTSSIAGHVDLAHEAVYSSAKHAVASFVNATRSQLAGRNVRIGAVAPGIVATPLWAANSHDSGADIPALVRDGRALTPQDVASAVMFMLEQPRHVNIRDIVILPADQSI